MNKKPKVTLNETIMNTTNTLRSLGFESKNSKKIIFLESLEYKKNTSRKFYDICFKHETLMVFVHIKINYLSDFKDITSVKNIQLIVTDTSSNSSTRTNRYALLPSVTALTKKVNYEVERVLRIADSKSKIEIDSQNRFPIVKEELEIIFGNKSLIERDNNHGVTVVYNNIKMFYSLYTTALNKNKKYTTLISFGSNDKFVPATVAKQMIDLI